MLRLLILGESKLLVDGTRTTIEHQLAIGVAAFLLAPYKLMTREVDLHQVLPKFQQ